MDILARIVQNIETLYMQTWKGFHAELSLTRARGQESGSARTPIVPAVLQEGNEDEVFLISEIKQASPSQGIIVENFDVAKIARDYIESGVNAISVLTEETNFKGCIEDIKTVRSLTSDIPILRKDFIVHPYQVWEAYNAGADMVLLIVAVLDDDMLAYLYEYISAYGMTPLVEVHDMHELERALALKPKMLGINNRNLKTFAININTTLSLLPHVPSDIVVISESGIYNDIDVSLLRGQGIRGILVGQSILQSGNMADKINELKLLRV